VHALNERVHRCYELCAWRALQQGGIVADAELDIRPHRAGLAEVPLNQRELRQGHVVGRSVFVRAQCARRSVENSVDELVAVRGSEALG
jgi:hypothetical protein